MGFVLAFFPGLYHQSNTERKALGDWTVVDGSGPRMSCLYKAGVFPKQQQLCALQRRRELFWSGTATAVEVRSADLSVQSVDFFLLSVSSVTVLKHRKSFSFPSQAILCARQSSAITYCLVMTLVTCKSHVAT